MFLKTPNINVTKKLLLTVDPGSVKLPNFPYDSEWDHLFFFFPPGGLRGSEGARYLSFSSTQGNFSNML